MTFDLLAEAASALSEASTAESAASESASDVLASDATLGDAVQDLVHNPEETISALGEFVKTLGDRLLNAVPTILFAIVILIIGLLVTKFALWVLSKGLSRSKLDVTVTKFTQQVVKIVLYVLLITIVLSILGIPSTSIITVIGTAGVAIGLALQDSLANVAGGFLLMITKPFKIGDYIIVNGFEGTVSQISILHTRLNSASNQAIFIPNGQAVNAAVVNNNGNEYRRVDMKFSISYSDDFEKAQKLILDLLKNHPLVDKSHAITVRMLEHGANAIIIAARPWCKGTDYWNVYFDAMEQVRAAFIENGISIPFNQLDVHMVDIK